MKKEYLCGCSLLLAFSLYGENKVETEKLEDVIVEATKISKYRQGGNSAATIFEVESEKLPIVVDTMTEDYIRDRGVSDIFDLIRTQPGVYSEGKTPMARTAGTYTIRGFGGNQVLMNGIALNGARGIWLDPSMMESVEIIKGPSAATLGAAGSNLGAYGATGSIIVNPKHASVERGNFNNLELKAVGGNDRSQRIAIDSNLILSEDNGVALRLPLAFQLGQPFYKRGGDDDRTLNLSPSLVWKANSDLTMGLSMSYQNIDRQSYQGIYTFKGKPANGLDWDSNPCDEDMRTELDTFFINGFADWRLNEIWSFKSSVAYSYSDTYRTGAALSKDRLGNISKTYCINDELEHSVNLAQYATAEFETGELMHALTIGATYTYTQTDKRSAFNLSSLENLNLSTESSTTHKLGLILQDTIRLGDWFLMLGGSGYLYRSAAGDDALSWSPRIGLSYQMTDDLILFGNVSTTSAP
ncbi:MAG: TonB-dependent siderophore receptor, partial [Lentisphaeria bacterium]